MDIIFYPCKHPYGPCALSSVSGGIHIHGVILAAGKGERMKGLTRAIPKALIQVSGKTLLELSIERLLKANIPKIIVAVGWKSDMIRDAITQFENLPDVQVIEVPKYEIGPLQTLTTVLNIIVKEEAIICPVDLLVSSDAIRMIISYHAENQNATVTLAVDSHGKLGSVVSVDSLGRVIGVQREVDNADSTVKSAMFMVVSPDFTEYCQAALNSGSTRAVSVLNNIIEKDHIIQSYSVRERWFDVDTISDVLGANKLLLESTKVQHRGSIFIPSGDIMEIGDTLDLGSGIKVGRGVSLNGPCLIQGNSKIGENSIIGPHASLDKGTEVGDYCEIQNAVIFGLSKIPTRSKVSGIVMYESESFKMEE